MRAGRLARASIRRGSDSESLRAEEEIPRVRIAVAADELVGLPPAGPVRAGGRVPVAPGRRARDGRRRIAPVAGGDRPADDRAGREAADDAGADAAAAAARVRGCRNRNGGQGQSAGRGKGSQGFLHDLPSWVVGGDRPSTERGFAAPSIPTCYWNRRD